ncbi:hypothetical protein B0H13DRAFT_2495921 [Mycena leptocephala]|nr:hypothetical protein B0H13DRAFT_2495921 [Mycena leptocephala]
MTSTCSFSLLLLRTLFDVSFDAEGSKEILTLYLERSGGCLISATLRGSNQGTSYCYKLLAERFSQIVPHMDRIWRLRIVLRTEWGGRRAGLLPRCGSSQFTGRRDQKRNRLGLFWDEIFSSGAPRLSFLNINVLGGYHSVDWINNSFLAAIATQCLYLHLDLSYISPTSARRFDLPALQFLHIVVMDGEDEAYPSLLEMIDLFDTPALTEFIIDGTHGDQIFSFFNATSFPHSSFPALTSLSFINTDSCTAWPKEDMFDVVRNALEDVVDSKRQRGQPIPAIRLFRTLEVCRGMERSRKVCSDFGIVPEHATRKKLMAKSAC